MEGGRLGLSASALGVGALTPLTPSPMMSPAPRSRPATAGGAFLDSLMDDCANKTPLAALLRSATKSGAKAAGGRRLALSDLTPNVAGGRGRADGALAPDGGAAAAVAAAALHAAIADARDAAAAAEQDKAALAAEADAAAAEALAADVAAFEEAARRAGAAGPQPTPADALAAVLALQGRAAAAAEAADELRAQLDAARGQAAAAEGDAACAAREAAAAADAAAAESYARAAAEAAAADAAGDAAAARAQADARTLRLLQRGQRQKLPRQLPATRRRPRRTRAAAVTGGRRGARPPRLAREHDFGGVGRAHRLGRTAVSLAGDDCSVAGGRGRGRRGARGGGRSRGRGGGGGGRC